MNVFPWATDTLVTMFLHKRHRYIFLCCLFLIAGRLIAHASTATTANIGQIPCGGALESLANDPHQFNFDATDPWEVLGLKRGASEEEIKRVFKIAAVRYHPDRNPGNETVAVRFKKIKDAIDEIKESGGDLLRATLDDIMRIWDLVSRPNPNFLEGSPRDFVQSATHWAESERLNGAHGDLNPKIEAVFRRIERLTTGLANFKEAFLACVRDWKEGEWTGPGSQVVRNQLGEMLSAIYNEFVHANPTQAELKSFRQMAGNAFQDLTTGRNPTRHQIANLREWDMRMLNGEVVAIQRDSIVLRTPQGDEYLIRIAGREERGLRIDDDRSAQTRRLGDMWAEVGDHIRVRIRAEGDGTIEAYGGTSLLSPSPARLERYQAERRRMAGILGKMEKASERNDWLRFRKLGARVTRNEMTPEETAHLQSISSNIPESERPIYISDRYAVEHLNRAFDIELDGMTLSEFLNLVDRWARREMPTQNRHENYLFRAIRALGLPDEITRRTAQAAVESRLTHFERLSERGERYNNERDFSDRFYLEESLKALADLPPTFETIRFALAATQRIWKHDRKGWGFSFRFTSSAFIALESLARNLEHEEIPEIHEMRLAFRNSLRQLVGIRRRLAQNPPPSSDPNPGLWSVREGTEWFSTPYGTEWRFLSDLTTLIESWRVPAEIEHRP